MKVEITRTIQYQPERACVYVGMLDNQQVLIKDSGRPARFQHEAEVYRRLSSSVRGKARNKPLVFPKLVDINDAEHRLIIEYVNGVSLKELLNNQDRSLSSIEKYTISKKLLEATGFFNKSGIAHLDGHPDNVIYDSNSERLVLFDYDLSLLGNPSLKKVKNDYARAATTKSTFYLPNVPGVTIHAPELMQVGTIDGEAADRYSTACTVIQVCWGFQPLLESTKNDQTRLNIGELRQAVQMSPQYRPEQSPLLEQLLVNLSFDPKKRNSSYKRLISTLDTLISYDSKGLKSKPFSSSRRPGL